MIYLFFTFYILISQAIHSLCQASFGVKIQKRTSPDGTVTYYYNGKPYKDINSIYNEIQSQNPGYKLVFQNGQSDGINKNSISGGSNGLHTNYGQKNFYSPGFSSGYNRQNGNNIPYQSNSYGTFNGNNAINNPYTNNKIDNSLGYNPNNYPNSRGNKIDNNLHGIPSNTNPNELSFNYNGLGDFYGRHPYSDKISKEIWAGYNLNTDRWYKYSDMKSRFLKESNLYRRRHKANSLIFSDMLQNKAQKYAEHLASTGNLQHDYQNKIDKTGENIGFASGPAAHIIVKKWYDENLGYDYTKNYPQPGKGHFSQLVWFSSTYAGFGVAADLNGGIYVVCKYSPAGNMYGQYTKNVFPP